jgi:hypothetical protein
MDSRIMNEVYLPGRKLRDEESLTIQPARFASRHYREDLDRPAYRVRIA